ncbi:MAG: ATP-binding protein, partial [Polyangiales bacterium]
QLDHAGDQKRRGKRQRVPPDPASEGRRQRAQRELAQARAAFLSLSRAEQRALLNAHESRRADAAARSSAQRRKAEQLEQLTLQADQLAALLEGQPGPGVDLRSLLEIDLADLVDLADDPQRRRSFVDDEVETETSAPPASDDVDSKLAYAKRRRDALWRQFMALDADAREELLASHSRPPDSPADPSEHALEAEEAAVEAAQAHELAVVDSQLAQTEAARLVAEHRATLLGVKEAQARFEAQLAHRQDALAAATETALGWDRRVRELRDSVSPGPVREQQADELYPSLKSDLSVARDDLQGALDAVREPPFAVPVPTEEGGIGVASGLDDDGTRQLRAELVREAERLRALDVQSRWDQAAGLRDSVVSLNQARLGLFKMLSESRRDDLEGFGSEGVAQVKRELDQIVLEARFHLLALPRELADHYQQLRSDPGPALLSLFQLFLLIAVFRWWRKRADATLEDYRRGWMLKRPQTTVTRGVAAAVWYLRRVRKPIEWFALFAVLSTWLAGSSELGETKYLQIIVLWLLTGAFVVQLIDATASRQGGSSESRARLRFRSLRMVGVSVVGVGLVLSLTDLSVGRGAIYAWVISSFWFLAIPLVAILVVWWKDAVFEDAKIRESSRLLAWVAAHAEGPLKYPAALVGGAYLLFEGIAAFFTRRASDLAPLRGFFSYLFRRGIEKSASAVPLEYGTEPIAEELEDAFADRVPTPDELVTSYMTKEVHAMRALVRSDSAAIVAVVGEQGLGKTTFLHRVTSDMEPKDVCRVQCRPGGFASLLREFARALDLPESASEADLVASLRERSPRVICVDDAQRLVRPLIGGLKDIDLLSRFARQVGPETSWLIAIGAPGWNYLVRARGERAAFDHVIDLSAWEESSLVDLIEKRTRAAGLAPSFDRLVVPRQLQVSPVTAEERTKRDFFRILWDYAGGNPRVALHFWGESLYRRPPDETVQVRLFSGPSAGDLDDLPLTFYFVLRTVVQLQLAVERDVVACSDLSAADVADALRAARVRGYLSEHDRLFEIDVHWYRAITSILRRKHLLLI